MMNRGSRLRATMLCVAASAAAIGISLAVTSSALADDATSPTGMVSVSVPSPVVAGAASPYTLTVTNATSSPMANVVAVGNLPSGVTLKNIAGCARLGGNQSASFLCMMPSLAPGASESATLNLLASVAGVYDITFTIAAGQPVPDSPGALQSVSDSVTLPVTVQPGPTDVQVTGASNNGAPAVGSAFNYTFQVKNNGPLPAAGVTFDDTLPASILLGGAVSVDNGSCTADALADSVHCDIGSLAVGQQSTITLPATPTATGLVANTATVAMTGADTHPANDSFTVTVQPK